MRMARILALVLFVVSVPCARGQQPHPHADSLYKQAVDSMKLNLIDAVNPRLIKELGQPIQEKLDGGSDFSVMLGPNLTKGRRGLYLAAWGDKLFTFSLTSKQIEMAGLRSGGVQVRGSTREKDVGRTPEMVRLSSVTLDGGKRHKMNQDLAGSVKFTVNKQFEGHAVLRVSCLSEGQLATQFFPLPNGLPDGDRISFRLKPLKSINGRFLPSPSILFVDLCSSPDADNVDTLTVRSNAVAVLVDLVE